MESIKLILVMTVVLALGTGGVLYAWGGGDGTYSEDGAVRIPGSPATVFEWLSDPKRRPTWVPGLSHATQEGFGNLEEGTKLTEDYEDRIEDLVWEVLDAESGKRLALKTVRDGVEIVLRYRLKTHNSGRQTLVTLTLEAQFEGWWPKLIEPIGGSRLFNEFRSHLELLAAVDLQT